MAERCRLALDAGKGLLCSVKKHVSSFQKTHIMSKLKLQKATATYSTGTVGTLNDFEGKAFVKDTLQITGFELSLGTLAAGGAVPFRHHHRENEEIYLFISGEGIMALDSEDLHVASDTIVRVSPAVSRQLRNTGTAPPTLRLHPDQGRQPRALHDDRRRD